MFCADVETHLTNSLDENPNVSLRRLDIQNSLESVAPDFSSDTLSCCLTLHRPSLSSSGALKIEVGGNDLLDRIWERWRQLCKSTQSEPFALPEWTAIYLKSFQPLVKLHLIAVSDCERLLAVLPLIRTRGFFAGLPIRKLVCPANVHSVRFSFPRVSGMDGELATRAIWHVIKSSVGWDVVEFPIFLENGPCREFFQYAKEDGYCDWTRLYFESPVLQMQIDDHGKLDWRHGTSRHFRHELRRFNRILESQLGVTARLVRHTKYDVASLNKFFCLEAAGWKGAEGSAIAKGLETRLFYGELARAMADLNAFSLYLFEANGTTIAAAYGVTTDRCFYPMKIAYEESLHRCGPGHLMFNSIFEECSANGIGTVYFGGVKDRYKTMWTSEVQRNLTGVIFNSRYYPQLVRGMKMNIFPILKRCRQFIRRNTRTANQESHKQ